MKRSRGERFQTIFADNMSLQWFVMNCTLTIQGLHSLEKSLNFRGVLEFHFSLKVLEKSFKMTAIFCMSPDSVVLLVAQFASTEMCIIIISLILVPFLRCTTVCTCISTQETV